VSKKQCEQTSKGVFDFARFARKHSWQRLCTQRRKKGSAMTQIGDEPCFLTPEDDLSMLNQPMAPPEPGPPWWRGKWPAEGIKYKQDLVPYLKCRLNDLCSASWSSEAAVLGPAAKLARQAVRNAHAAIVRLGEGKPSKPGPEQLNQLSGIETALEDLLDFISPGWGKEEFVANVRTNDVSTQLREAMEASQDLLRVTRLDDLGIGIDKDGSYLAFLPCPEFGAQVAITSATKLNLKGERWPKVLELLANSEDGRTAKKSDLIYYLRYFRGGTPREIFQSGSHESHDEKQARYEKLEKAKESLRKLTDTMADLGRLLKKQVATDDNTIPFESVSTEHYRAAFTTRYLFRDNEGRRRFGTTP
jgi:hypothetical protein